jgi:hypothetical protein
MKFSFFIALFFISAAGLCQKSDFLVKTNGDTIWGNIQLKNKSFYVNGHNGTESEVSVDEVRKIKSRNYRGSTVVHCLLQLYTDDVNEIELDWIKRGVEDTVMILDEILSTPKINLYFGQSDQKTHFYFYKTPSDPFPVQLVVRYFLQGGLANYTNDRSRYRGDRSKLNIVEDKGYVNQLHAIMEDCDQIPETMWEILTYRDYSLKQLIKRYNRCN